MPTTPLTASRIPDLSYSPDVPADITRGISDLEDNTTPNFTTTGARDTAYGNWVAAGGVMRNGLSCWCDSPGAYFDRIGGVWEQRGLAAYAKATNPSDLTQVANVWCTVPVSGLSTEGRSGTYTIVQRNNIAYTAHPARNVIRFERGGLYQVEGQQFTDTVGVQIRLARNIDTALEALAVSPSAVTSGGSSASTTRRFATGDVVALQGYHTAAYIVRADGTQLGTSPNVYTVNTHITVTRVGD